MLLSTNSIVSKRRYRWGCGKGVANSVGMLVEHMFNELIRINEPSKATMQANVTNPSVYSPLVVVNLLAKVVYEGVFLTASVLAMALLARTCPRWGVLFLRSKCAFSCAGIGNGCWSSARGSRKGSMIGCGTGVRDYRKLVKVLCGVSDARGRWVRDEGTSITHLIDSKLRNQGGESRH